MTPLDTTKNLCKVTVSTGYDASATVLVLTTGDGAKLPTAPFNATWWNATDYADPAEDPNVEVVRVLTVVNDTINVTRGQESLTASTKNTASKTYRMFIGLTALTITNVASALIEHRDQIIELQEQMTEMQNDFQTLLLYLNESGFETVEDLLEKYLNGEAVIKKGQ